MKTARWLFSFLTRPGGKPRSRASACQWCRRCLGAFYRWDDSLSGAELSEIERHVNACPECGKIWNEFRANQDRLVEAALPSFDKERVLGSILRQIDSRAGSETRERQGYFLPSGWSLRFAGVCLVLVALPVLARFGLELAKTIEVSPKAAIQSSLDSPAPADSTANTERDKAIMPHQESGCTDVAIGPDPSELELLNLPGEDVDRTFLLATLPRTDEQLEEWARKEFPHVMWLYDELRELDDTLSWQDLLVRSGEIYRFDWPIGPDEPNVLPRLSAVIRVAEAAGWKAEIAAGNQQEQSRLSHLFETPPLEWADLLKFQPACERSFLLLSQTARGSWGKDSLRTEETLNRLVAMQESLDQVVERGIHLDSSGGSKEPLENAVRAERYSFVLTSSRIIEKCVRDPGLTATYAQLRKTPVSRSICGRTKPVLWRELVDLWNNNLHEEIP